MFAWCLTGKTLRSIKIYGLLIEDTTDFVLSSSEHSKYKQVYLSRLGGKLSLPSPETFIISNRNYTCFIIQDVCCQCGMEFSLFDFSNILLF